MGAMDDYGMGMGGGFGGSMRGRSSFGRGGIGNMRTGLGSLGGSMGSGFGGLGDGDSMGRGSYSRSGMR